MRPVIERMCLYSELMDGSLSLTDIALMNDALTVKAENQRRADEAARSP